jgi:hypothetical protein
MVRRELIEYMLKFLIEAILCNFYHQLGHAYLGQ